MTRVTQKKAGAKRAARARKAGAEKAARKGGQRERQKLATRERIKAAAWELFVYDGYDAVTTKDVARAARVATGTVFLHASNKADLLFLVMHDRLAKMVDRQMATVPDKPLVEQLMHVFGGLFALYGQHPKLAAEFIRQLPGAQGQNAAQVHALTFAFHRQLAQLVIDAQKAGEVSVDIEAMQAALNLFVLYFGALQSWLNGLVSLQAALEPGLRVSLELQMKGLRA
jgi:TetR/AcrR family transcriptional regulator, cholesterol catabolism regulator